MTSLLRPVFYKRDTLRVAKDLIGCFLCRRLGRSIVRLRITEVEAYDGLNDRASHASKGMTARTAVMFGPPGVWYVYFVYGVHWMLNIVTGPKGYPAAVLVRGAGPYSGPGKLTKYLGVTKSQNGRKAQPPSGLWIEKGSLLPGERIINTRRIGVDYAGPMWSKRKYRFVLSSRISN